MSWSEEEHAVILFSTELTAALGTVPQDCSEHSAAPLGFPVPMGMPLKQSCNA